MYEASDFCGKRKICSLDTDRVMLGNCIDGAGNPLAPFLFCEFWRCMKMEIDCGFTKGDCWFRYRAAGIIVEEGFVLFAGNDVDDYLYSVGGGVHVGETAEEAVVREVFEETGVHYEVDRLAFIHENFFECGSGTIQKLHCHELTFYFLMKPRGIRQLNSHSSTSAGVAEHMHWVPIEDLRKQTAYPTFLPEKLGNLQPGIEHIVTHE